MPVTITIPDDVLELIDLSATDGPLNNAGTDAVLSYLFDAITEARKPVSDPDDAVFFDDPILRRGLSPAYCPSCGHRIPSHYPTCSTRRGEFS